MTTELERINALVAPIEARKNKATPGPWLNAWDTPENKSLYADETVVFAPEQEGMRQVVVGLLYYDGLNTACRREDAEFIAHAHDDESALIAELRAMAAQNDEQSERVAEVRARNAELVKENDRLRDAGEFNFAEGQKARTERDALRERLAKLEAVATIAVFVREMLDATGHPLKESNAEFASLDRAIDDLHHALNDAKGGG